MSSTPPAPASTGITQILSRLVAAIGGIGVILSVIAPFAQDALKSFVTSHPSVAGVAAFLAVIFSVFLPKPTTNPPSAPPSVTP